MAALQQWWTLRRAFRCIVQDQQFFRSSLGCIDVPCVSRADASDTVLVPPSQDGNRGWLVPTCVVLACFVPTCSIQHGMFFSGVEVDV